MCGFAGYIDLENRCTASEHREIATRMCDSLAHRGPDDSGVWSDAEAGVVLGHRRLSIIDLSPEGHQPMISANGRYVIAYNGEIYNYKEIRQKLDSKWRGHSDTETLLAAINQWGLDHTLKACNGMFAFALWDRKDRILYLARDRIGKKPVYYGWVGNVFLFGSELKALRAHFKWSGEIDRNSLALLMRHNYIPAPYSIYKNVYKLLPGTVLALKQDRAAKDHYEVSNYWSAKEIAEAGIANQFDGSEEDAVDELDRLLRDAVRLRMEADVPLGALLSGGIDSSTVVALMQAQATKRIKTFSVGFYEDGYNEAIHAKKVAKYLGTDHTELYVTPEEAMAVIPRIPELYDEPFADSSQIPTFLVSQLAKKHVTVGLSGDGGDELFSGYDRYFWGNTIWNKIGWIPRPLRKLMSYTITSLSPQSWDKVFRKTGLKLPSGVRQGLPGDKLYKLSEMLAFKSPEEMYRGLISHWRKPCDIVLGSDEPMTSFGDEKRLADLPDFTHRMMYMDLISYLPDDILVKVDRASMGVSLEVRVPLLDHRVIEFAWSLPLSMKVKNGNGKHLLRRVLNKYVPNELVERPKMGFGLPIDSWLRGPLRDWAESLLEEKRMRDDGFFNPQPIRKKWMEHLSGGRNWQYHLWDVLMFQSWLVTQ